MEETLNPLAERIISLLIFEESFDAIVSELSGESVYAIGDELKSLIVRDLVKPCRELESSISSGILYDSDKLRSFSFTLTSKGITCLEKLGRRH